MSLPTPEVVCGNFKIVKKNWSGEAWWAVRLRQEVRENFEAAKSNGALVGEEKDKTKKRPRVSTVESNQAVQYMNVDDSESEGGHQFQPRD